jgi:hypothetical protein
MKKVVSTFILISVITSCLLSQTVHEQLNNSGWRIIPGMSCLNPRVTDGDFEKSRLYLSPDEIITLVSYGDDFCVILVNSHLQTKWVRRVNGVPIAIGRFHENLVVITSPEYKYDYYPTQLDGTIIDPVKGTVLLNKTLYTPKPDYYVKSFCLFNKNDNDLKIIVGSEKIPRGNIIGMHRGRDNSFSKEKKEIEHSLTDLQMLSFSEKLGVSISTPFSDAKDLVFLNIEANKSGEIFVACCSKDNSNDIQVKKFDKNGTILKQTISMPLDIAKGTIFTVNLLPSEKNDDVLYVNVEGINNKKAKLSSLSKLNFLTGVIQSADVIVDKDFITQKLPLYAANYKYWGKTLTEDWNTFTITKLLEHGDELLVYRETIVHGLYWPPDKHLPLNTLTSGAAILTTYNSQMQPVTDLTITKYLENIQPSFTFSSALHIEGNNLYILFGNDGKSDKECVFRITQVDLSTKTITKTTTLNETLVEKRFRANVDPQSSLWFSDGFTTSYFALETNMFFKITSITTATLKYNY